MKRTLCVIMVILSCCFFHSSFSSAVDSSEILTDFLTRLGLEPPSDVGVYIFEDSIIHSVKVVHPKKFEKWGFHGVNAGDDCDVKVIEENHLFNVLHKKSNKSIVFELDKSGVINRR